MKVIKPDSLINLRACQVCDSKKILRIFRRKKFKQLKRNIYQFDFDNFFCSNCNFIFSKKFPTDKFLKKYYEEYPVYFEKLEPKTVKIRLSFLKNIDKEKKILLIGETDSYLIKKIKNSFLRTRLCNVKTLIKLRERFDVIFCYMVLEHVGDIKKFIKKINQISNHKCKLFLGVPDSYNYFNSSFEGEHLCHFDKNNLKLFLQRYYGEVSFKKKTRNDDISVISEKNKKKSNFLEKGPNLYNYYLLKHNNLENEYKKIINKLNKYNIIGIMPANQIAIDILSEFKKKIFIFDKFKKAEIEKETGQINGKFMGHEIYDYNNTQQLLKCEVLLVTKSRYQNKIFSFVQNITHNSVKIIKMKN